MIMNPKKYPKRRHALSFAGLLVLVLAPSGAVLAQNPPAIAPEPVLEDRYPQRRVSFPGGVVSLADVTYSTIPGFRPLTLDLYLPPKTAAGARPLVICVHGGGWMSGHTRHSGAFENWPRAVVMGGSAGGQLAGLAATSCGVAALEPPAPQAAPGRTESPR